MSEHLYGGKRFDAQKLSRDGAWSVKCLDEPDVSEDGIDYTDWPSDEDVSKWIGVPVRFQDVGDDPEYVECIFYAVCPYCGSKEIEGTDNVDSFGSQPMVCLVCEKEFIASITEGDHG